MKGSMEHIVHKYSVTDQGSMEVKIFSSQIWEDNYSSDQSGQVNLSVSAKLLSIYKIRFSALVYLHLLADHIKT